MILWVPRWSMALTILLGLVGVLALAGCSSHGSPTGAAATNEAAATPAARVFAIEDMTCQGCAQTVTDAIAAVPGVKSVNVSLEKKEAVVVADPSQAPDETIEAAVVKAGYRGRLLSPERKASGR